MTKRISQAKPRALREERTQYDVSSKLEMLQEAYSDQAELDQVLTKLFDVVLSQYQSRLARYQQSLESYEKHYGMLSSAFYTRFEAGELGDSADFFEWAGLYELQQDLLEKKHHLELAL